MTISARLLPELKILPKRRHRKSKPRIDPDSGRPIARTTGLPDRRGRAKVLDQVRMRSEQKGTVVAFALSEDIMLQLLHLHDSLFKGLLATIHPERRKRMLRVEFIRMIDFGVNAVMLRVEAPSYDPKGNRIKPPVKGRQWIARIRARRIGMRDHVTPKIIEHIWMDEPQYRAIVLIIPEEDMLHPGPKIDVRKVFGHQADPWDLRA